MADTDRTEPIVAGESAMDRRVMLERLTGVGLAGAIFGGLGLFDAGVAAAAQNPASPVSGIALPQGVRRIITGHNAQGRSYIIQDDRVTRGTFPNMYKATGELPLGPAPQNEPRKIMPTDAPQLE